MTNSRDFPIISESVLMSGVKPLKRTVKFSQTFEIVGFDTETLPIRHLRGFLKYEPNYCDLYSVQLSTDRGGEKFFFSEGRQGVGWLEMFPRRSWVFSHNLAFDLGALLGKDYEKVIKGEILTTPDNHVVKARIQDGVMSFAYFSFYNLDGKKPVLTRNINFIDTANFYGKRKLETIATEQFPNDPDLFKFPKPEYIGERPPNPDELDYFVKYALQDAVLTRELGKKILENQRRYQITPAYTPASFSVKVFRSKFQKSNILLLNVEQLRFVWECYQGGRFEAFGRGRFEKVTGLDVNSLYPYSATFPFPLRRQALECYTLDDIENNPSIVGFYKCKFKFPENTPYPCLPVRTYKMFFPLTGQSSGSIYELRHALELGAEIYDAEILGFDPTPEETDHEIRAFVFEYYRKKQDYDKLAKERPLTQKEKEERQQIKLILNSFYGKFAERNRDYITGEWHAGKLFNPVVAGLITGKSREILSRYIIKYESLYSDTDAVITTKKPDKKDIGDALGKLKPEFSDCPITIIRPKQYLAELPGNNFKMARHSFRRKEDLIKALKEENADIDYFEYEIRRFIKPKEALARELNPRSLIWQPFKIRLNADEKRIYLKRLSTIGSLLKNNTLSRPLKKAPEVKPKNAF